MATKLTSREQNIIDGINEAFENNDAEMVWFNCMLQDTKLGPEVKKLVKLIKESVDLQDEHISDIEGDGENGYEEASDHDYDTANSLARENFLDGIKKACPKWYNKLVSEQNIKRNNFEEMWNAFIEADVTSHPDVLYKWYVSFNE